MKGAYKLGRPPQRQIMPRRLEMVVEKLDLAKECFEEESPDWLMLDDCQRAIRLLLGQLRA